MEKLASKQYLIQEWSNLQTFRQHTKKMLLSSLLFLPVSSGVQATVPRQARVLNSINEKSKLCSPYFPRAIFVTSVMQIQEVLASLLRISLLLFFKKFHKFTLCEFLGNFFSLVQFFG
jgi:hypothetical protein